MADAKQAIDVRIWDLVRILIVKSKTAIGEDARGGGARSTVPPGFSVA
jgi:hypothetical protein